MYAVIDHKGKQYKVRTGEEVLVDLMRAGEGELVQFDRVLAEVLRHEKGPKLTMMRHQATKNRQAKMGHRQQYTRVLIREIHPD
jgi:large subunit ribosomal protein L21